MTITRWHRSLRTTRPQSTKSPQHPPWTSNWMCKFKLPAVLVISTHAAIWSLTRASIMPIQWNHRRVHHLPSHSSSNNKPPQINRPALRRKPASVRLSTSTRSNTKSRSSLFRVLMSMRIIIRNIRIPSIVPWTNALVSTVGRWFNHRRHKSSFIRCYWIFSNRRSNMSVCLGNRNGKRICNKTHRNQPMIPIPIVIIWIQCKWMNRRDCLLTSSSDVRACRFLIEDQSSTVSFPIDVVVSLFIQPSVLLFTCLPTHPMECELRLPTVDVVFSSKRALPGNVPFSSGMENHESEQIIENSLGGLSFSLYMKDFKLNVYHPFSGESKVHLFEDFRSGQLQTRNALAVSVQSVSFNISRTRYTVMHSDGELRNRIQLSVIGQISKAQFEYDIRRFSEILTFPKIWYNRSLARRLFLGDENLPPPMPPSNTTSRPVAPITIKSTNNKRLRKEARVLLAIQLKELHISMRMSNVMGKVEWNTTDVCSTGSLTLTSEGQRALYFSIGLQKSIFQAEQGIIGGIVQLKNLRTTGLLRQGVHDRSSLHESSHVFDVLTDAIELRLDYMGSPTLMGRISHILLRLKDDHHGRSMLSPGSDSISPSTLVVLNLEWSQLHLMITRSTTPDIIKMATKLTEFFNAQISNSKTLLASIQYDFHDGVKRNPVEKKPPSGQSKYDTSIIKRCIGMHGGELMLQGHNLTLVVFHGLNFKSRQWALFSLNEPHINFVTDRGEKGDSRIHFILDRLAFLTVIVRLFQSTRNCSSFWVIKDRPYRLRQSLERTWLRSRKWREAAMKHLRIWRSTNGSLTPVRRFLLLVSRRVHMISMNECSSERSTVGLRDFPSMDDAPSPIPPNKVRAKQFEKNAESIFILPSSELRFQTRQLDGNSSSIIARMVKCTIDRSLGQVHCSFETEFYEHIMFSFNAEHFYFLHDLISSYIKEKERGEGFVRFRSAVELLSVLLALTATSNDKHHSRAAPAPPTAATAAATGNLLDNPPLPSFEEVRSDDIRRFHIPDAKWKLQPTIKLLTAYGNEVEPFGADYILQKLGFRHARLTIPKWLQRGIMDPCEQSMTVVQLFLIFLLPERFKELCMRQWGWVRSTSAATNHFVNPASQCTCFLFSKYSSRCMCVCLAFEEKRQPCCQ